MSAHCNHEEITMTVIDQTLATPLRGATFGQAFSRFWSKYATFSGRASASEFWWAQLFVVVPSLVASGFISASPMISGLATLWTLATFIPSLAVTWRRLHDANRSGGNWFFSLIPVVGWIILLVRVLGAPNPAGERFDA
jgi:uncharacterized membrane protein YhaH (DUF805 family)